MAFNFSFRLAEDRRDLRKLEKHLIEQPLDYPYYEDWVERCIQELGVGYKSSILAFSEGFLVGNLIFQPHKDFPRLLELKNIRVNPKLSGRYFGGFMLRQAEVEGRNNYDAIICDTRSDNLQAINLLKFHGYEELVRAPLYQNSEEEVIMTKIFEFTPPGIFVPVERKLVGVT